MDDNRRTGPRADRQQFDLQSLGVLSGPPDPAFERAVTLARHAMRADSVILSILDAASNTMIQRAGAGGATGGVLPAELSLMAHLDAPDEVIAIPDVRRDSRTRHHPCFAMVGAASVLSAPVHGPAEEPIGMLSVAVRSARIWSEAEHRAVEALAGFCSQAILLRAAFMTLHILSSGRRDGARDG